MPAVSTHECALGFNWCKSKKRVVKIKQERDLDTVEFVEDYEEQESGYNIKWN